MTPRPGQPEPFIRGAAYPAVGEVPYPRANPTDTARLPADVWHAATVPVGIRLEVVGDAKAIDVAYRTTTGNLGYRGDGAGITFSVWRGGRKACEEEAVLGDGLIRLSLGSGSPDEPAIIYLPEGMHPVVQSLTAVRGEIAPAPQLPRWIAYGDWTTQGWTASGPSQGWTAIAARKAGLDVINFGYAGAGRGENVSAEHISALQAAVITIAYGASCWTRVPYSVGMVTEGFRAFLDVIRQGHPTTPIVVASPIVRPDAEDVPNRLGASMADIRHTIETIARERIVAGDTTLSLVAGESIITEDHLIDGIHPGDEGHKRIASAMARALASALKSTGEHPESDAPRGNAILFGGGTGLGHPDAEALDGSGAVRAGEDTGPVGYAESGEDAMTPAGQDLMVDEATDVDEAVVVDAAVVEDGLTLEDELALDDGVLQAATRPWHEEPDDGPQHADGGVDSVMTEGAVEGPVPAEDGVVLEGSEISDHRDDVLDDDLDVAASH